MLLSMTGHGEARLQQSGLAVAVELRSINNRFFKVTTRTSEGYTGLEPQIELYLRGRVRRGTVLVNVRVHREQPSDQYQVNVALLDRYRRQLEALRLDWSIAGSVPLESLLMLPGVVDADPTQGPDLEADWPVIGKALAQAADGLDRMRQEEGRAMAEDLRANCRTIAENLQAIRVRAAATVENYRKRLEERVQSALEEYAVKLVPGDLIREVALYAERSDIAEEVVRLGSHLEQFDQILDEKESSGRKLEFLTQEMLRETNTIGSKSYDVEIARHVIEIKATIERLREMVQNVE